MAPGIYRDRIASYLRGAPGVPHRIPSTDRDGFIGLWPGFCQALQSRVGGSGEWPKDGPAESVQMWNHFPWLTPVLGSGALGWATSDLLASSTLPEDVVGFFDLVREPPSALPSSVKSALALMGEDVEATTELNERLGSFVRALLEDRGVGPGSPPNKRANGETPTLTNLTVLILLAACEVTALFHSLSLRSSRLVSRRDTGVARSRDDISTDVFPSFDLLMVSLAEIQKQLNQARDNFSKGAARLVSAIRDDLNDGKLKARDVKSLSDLSWHFLARPNQNDRSKASAGIDYPYPGWTDLLLELTVAAGGGTTHVQGVDLEKLTETIRSVIEPVARRNWKSREVTASGETNAHPLSQAERLHDAVAEVLVGQSQAEQTRASAVSKSSVADRASLQSHLPRSVAMVTTFDVELESALCRLIADSELRSDSKRMSMILPVYVLEKRESLYADFAWIEATIDLSSTGAITYEQVTQPTQWRVISASRIEVPHHPYVIHLAGAPLIKLPNLSEDYELQEELRKVGIALPPDSTQCTLIHAVTVHEYLALRQSELELHWIETGALGGADQNGIAKAHDRSLPSQLLGTTSPGPTRYWMALGVPIMDPAIRHRLYSHMTRMRFTRGVAKAPETRVGAAGPHQPEQVEMDGFSIASQQASAHPDLRPSGEREPDAALLDDTTDLSWLGLDEPVLSPLAVEVPMPVAVSSTATAPAVGGEVMQRQPSATASDEMVLGERTVLGMTVNLRCTDEEVILLATLDIDVVKCRCEDFTDDLRHYASHLTAVGRNARPVRSETFPCKLHNERAG